MFTVYALYSPSHDKIYIGYTSDLDALMLSHNKLGKKGWTIKYRPWEIVHAEEYESKAMKREKQLKTAKERKFIWNLVKKKFNLLVYTFNTDLFIAALWLKTMGSISVTIISTKNKCTFYLE